MVHPSVNGYSMQLDYEEGIRVHNIILNPQSTWCVHPDNIKSTLYTPSKEQKGVLSFRSTSQAYGKLLLLVQTPLMKLHPSPVCRHQ